MIVPLWAKGAFGREVSLEQKRLQAKGILGFEASLSVRHPWAKGAFGAETPSISKVTLSEEGLR